MTKNYQYEILNSLPAYGPMYIPVSNTDEPSFSEGFVVKFFKPDGTNWVGNFKLGTTILNKVFYYQEKNRFVIIAGGLGYIINPNEEKPTFTFGLTISNIYQVKDGSLICVDDIGIIILDNSNGEIWESERISWGGFKDLMLENEVLSGQSYDSTNQYNQWCKFTFDIVTKEIRGGSFREMIKKNPHLKMKNRIEVEKVTYKKPWWKFW